MVGLFLRIPGRAGLRSRCSALPIAGRRSRYRFPPHRQNVDDPARRRRSKSSNRAGWDNDKICDTRSRVPAARTSTSGRQCPCRRSQRCRWNGQSLSDLPLKRLFSALVVLGVFGKILGAQLRILKFPPAASPSNLYSCLRFRKKARRLLSTCKGRIPEMKMKDLAFARQKIVFDIQPIHGFQMPAQDRDRNQIGDGGSFVAAFLDRVQRLQTDLQVLLVLRVPLRDPGVEIPAVVVETRLARPVARFPPVIFSQCSETRQPHQPPARRCCRCSSEHPLPCPRTSTGGQKCRPEWRCANGRHGPPCWD